MPSEPGASTPTRVIVARLRISAVIGMSVEQRLPDLGRGQVLGLHRLARQAVLADERRALARRRRHLRAREALDQARQTVRRAAADDPLEQASVLVRDIERRVAGADSSGRVSKTQHVTMRHAVTLPVLHRLVGERVGRLRRVPAADRASQRAAPAAEALDERDEPEQVRARARDLRQRRERRLARRLVSRAGRERERVERRVVLRRAALAAHANDLRDGTHAVLADRFARPLLRSRASASTRAA